jgi:hypothetical protein
LPEIRKKVAKFLYSVNKIFFVTTHFVFPEANTSRKLRSYPVEIGGEHLNFAFIEVGCKHHKKRSQLKNKKELFLKYWGDTYRNPETGIDWNPHIFRVMSHYNPVHKEPKAYNKYSVDAIIYHKYISPEQLQRLTPRDKESIYHVVRKQSEQELLEEILETNDANRLQKVIVEGDKQNRYSTLRGKMAEILTQHLLYEAVNEEEMVSYRNGTIKYFNRRFDQGAEIDQVFQFYGEQPFYNMIIEVAKFDNLAVTLDTQK